MTIRPGNSSYDIMIARSEDAAQDVLDALTPAHGERIGYETAEALDDVAWNHIRRQIGTGRFDIVDDGESWVLVQRCQCGDVYGSACEHSDPLTDDQAVTVEYMPESLRASHEAAGNRGVYPHNGSVRLRVTAECADLIVENDPEWAEIVNGQDA